MNTLSVVVAAAVVLLLAFVPAAPAAMR